jgi:hypothetical protein
VAVFHLTGGLALSAINWAWGIGNLKMGKGEKEKNYYQCPMPYAPFPNLVKFCNTITKRTKRW